MIGWVATHLSPWAPAVTMNLLSALFHAAAVGLIALLTARLVEPGWPASSDRGRSALAGAAAGGVLAVSTGFWSYALVAEVFTLNDLFAVALLLLAIEWFRDRSIGVGTARHRASLGPRSRPPSDDRVARTRSGTTALRRISGGPEGNPFP